MRYKVEAAPRPAYLALEAGDRFAGRQVVESTPGSPHLLLDLPDHWTSHQVDAYMRDLAARGVIVDDGHGLWRPEHIDYGPVYSSGFSLEASDTVSGSVSQSVSLDLSTDYAPAYELGDSLPRCGITPEVQARGKYGAGVRVAVLDTGCKPTHSLFQPLLAEQRLSGDLEDGHGHGTAMASTLILVAPSIILRVWNVLPGGRGSESGIAAGIRAAADWGAKVQSLSLGGSPSSIIDAAVQYARQRGCLVFASAGNGGSREPMGSPARAADCAILAADRQNPAGLATFSDGNHPQDAQHPGRMATPGVQIISAFPDGGTNPVDGTSPACPHAAGASALLDAAGFTRQQNIDYLRQHRGGAPLGLGLQMRADFGAAVEPPPPPPADDWLELVRGHVEESIRVLDEARFVTRATNPNGAFDQLGSVAVYLGQALEVLPTDPKAPEPEPPPEPEPEPPPEPSRFLGVYGTYNGHGNAVDLYGGRNADEVAWGHHHGLPLVAPVDGRVEVYSFGTPLGTQEHQEPLYAAQWRALFESWVCWASPFQTMFVAVFWPAVPLTIEGQRIGHLHYGHVRSDIRSGAIRRGEAFAVAWDSGIRFEPGVPNARAAHVHCVAGSGAQLSPNGDLPGRLAAIAQGWQLTDIRAIPGPAEYQSGRYTAGRLTTDFQAAGKPIPPMPG